MNFRPDAGSTVLAARVLVTELPPCARFSLRAGPVERGAVGRAFGLELPERIGARVAEGGKSALCLGPDEWVLHAPEAEAAAIRDAFAGINVEATHSLVDISDREIALAIEGPAALELLACGCPRDLARLPVGAGTRTVFDSAQVVLLREAEDRFRLEVWRSFVPHVRAILATASAQLAVGL
jgi:sarcosine oxidase, subunit gamma